MQYTRSLTRAHVGIGLSAVLSLAIIVGVAHYLMGFTSTALILVAPYLGLAAIGSFGSWFIFWIGFKVYEKVSDWRSNKKPQTDVAPAD